MFYVSSCTYYIIILIIPRMDHIVNQYEVIVCDIQVK